MRTKIMRRVRAVITVILMVGATLAVTASAQQTPRHSVKVTRLVDRPIIQQGIDASIGENIQGPSLIRVPDWVQDPLGRYYLYFADHKGL